MKTLEKTTTRTPKASVRKLVRRIPIPVNASKAWRGFLELGIQIDKERDTSKGMVEQLLADRR